MYWKKNIAFIRSISLINIFSATLAYPSFRHSNIYNYKRVPTLIPFFSHNTSRHLYIVSHVTILIISLCFIYAKFEFTIILSKFLFKLSKLRFFFFQIMCSKLVCYFIQHEPSNDKVWCAYNNVSIFLVI